MSNVTFDEDEFLLCPSSTGCSSANTDVVSQTKTDFSYYQPSTYNSLQPSSSVASTSHGLECKNLMIFLIILNMLSKS